jgi:hypothetical protein
MHRMIVSVLRTLYIKQKRMLFFSCRLHHPYFNIVSPDASVFFEFQQSFALHFVFYIEEKAKNNIEFGCACLGLFLSGIYLLTYLLHKAESFLRS